MPNNKMSKTQNNKKEDGKFKKANKKHGQAESSRTVFGCQCEKNK